MNLPEGKSPRNQGARGDWHDRINSGVGRKEREGAGPITGDR